MQKNDFVFQLLQNSLIIDKLHAMLPFYTFEIAKKNWFSIVFRGIGREHWAKIDRLVLLKFIGI